MIAASLAATQDSKAEPSPTGVVYDTSMASADAALALAALYVSSSRRQSRVNGVAINGAGFDAAIFCDIVARFYTGTSRAPSSNTALPIGFAADGPVLPAPPMVERAVNRKRPNGDMEYVRSIQRVTDTSAPDAMLRNALTFTEEAVVVLSAPATWLAKSLALSGTPAVYRKRVKRVVIVDAGGLDQDRTALASLLAALPQPPIRCGRDVGTALSVPRSQLQSLFGWAPANPVADALADTPTSTVALNDVAALHYAIHPESGFFRVAEGRLAVEPSKKDDCLAALVALATAKPAAPTGRGR